VTRGQREEGLGRIIRSGLLFVFILADCSVFSQAWGTSAKWQKLGLGRPQTIAILPLPGRLGENTLAAIGQSKNIKQTDIIIASTTGGKRFTRERGTLPLSLVVKNGFKHSLPKGVTASQTDFHTGERQEGETGSFPLWKKPPGYYTKRLLI